VAKEKQQQQGGGGGKDKGLTTRAEDYSGWYNEIVETAELAEHAPVRGCMVIKPYGYAIWEGIQRTLDGMIKATGHKNAYFPMFIPKSFLQREAKHVEGFAMECAVVTHSRLEKGADGQLKPASPLEEELVCRPTSETIIMHSFKKWIQSYRDLPLLINQWANVIRWEMRTRLFLRTLEFLWQEGHTAHATYEDAEEETRKMLEVYRVFAEETMAIPVYVGKKTESEKFAGAMHTYCIEAMMQDKKALQAGTSHNLGQNFAKAFEITYLSKEQKQETCWTTSWGVSTRLVGGLIMTHADDKGLVIPPKLAPIHVVIVPIWKTDEERVQVLAYANGIKAGLEKFAYGHGRLAVEIDARDLRPGNKYFEWERKGVPLRVECGPRDLASGNVVVVSRLDGAKTILPKDKLVADAVAMLDAFQKALFEKAKRFRDENTILVDGRDAFVKYFTPANAEKPEIHGGFARGGWCEKPECEKRAKEELKVTIRCIELDGKAEAGTCVICGAASPRRVIWAKSY
jgi:prolyl-tRNA synthetase